MCDVVLVLIGLLDNIFAYVFVVFSGKLICILYLRTDKFLCRFYVLVEINVFNVFLDECVNFSLLSKLFVIVFFLVEWNFLLSAYVFSVFNRRTRASLFSSFGFYSVLWLGFIFVGVVVVVLILFKNVFFIFVVWDLVFVLCLSAFIWFVARDSYVFFVFSLK